MQCGDWHRYLEQNNLSEEKEFHVDTLNTCILKNHNNNIYC